MHYIFKKNLRLIMVLAFIGTTTFLTTGCYKNFVPDEKDFFSKDASFSRTDFDVNLGRTSVFLHIYNPDYSTQPLEFSILRFRKADTVYLTTDSSKYEIDTVPAPELEKIIKTREWKSYYSGKEKSIEEINAKRFERERPVLYMRPHSGDLFFFNTDASVVKPGVYFFDTEVKNGGGSKVFPMTMRVRRAHPYEPYNYDDITGERKPANSGGIIHPSSMSGVVNKFGEVLPVDSVDISFHKFGSPRNTLSIKFLDQNSMPIKLSKFNMMKWDSLTYRTEMNDVDIPFGFNRRMNDDSTVVTWDIPNPFPVLTDVSGASVKASINFRYNRVSFGRRVNANIHFDFSILEPGQWMIVFKFKENPKFEDD